MQFLATNIKYPELAKQMNIEGQIIAEFVVDTDGSLTDIHIIRSLSAPEKASLKDMSDEEAETYLKNYKEGARA